MNTPKLDRLPVGQLASRYGIGRTSLYKRMSDLSLKPHALGSKAYVDAEQVALLDRLHQHLNAGGQTAEFLEVVGGQLTKQSDEQYPEPFSEQSVSVALAQFEHQRSLLRSLETIAGSLSSPPQGVNELSLRLHLLQDACDYGWLLPTSELAQILKVSSRSLSRYHSLQRYGFTFMKGGRMGVESVWEVSKHDP